MSVNNTAYVKTLGPKQGGVHQASKNTELRHLCINEEDYCRTDFEEDEEEGINEFMKKRSCEITYLEDQNSSEGTSWVSVLHRSLQAKNLMKLIWPKSYF